VDNAEADDLRALDSLANVDAQVTGRRVVHQAGHASRPRSTLEPFRALTSSYELY
jgi:hypothetical protein